MQDEVYNLKNKEYIKMKFKLKSQIIKNFYILIHPKIKLQLKKIF